MRVPGLHGCILCEGDAGRVPSRGRTTGHFNGLLALHHWKQCGCGELAKVDRETRQAEVKLNCEQFVVRMQAVLERRCVLNVIPWWFGLAERMVAQAVWGIGY